MDQLHVVQFRFSLNQRTQKRTRGCRIAAGEDPIPTVNKTNGFGGGSAFVAIVVNPRHNFQFWVLSKKGLLCVLVLMQELTGQGAHALPQGSMILQSMRESLFLDDPEIRQESLGVRVRRRAGHK
jgi:hypothetical protein